MEKFDSWTLSSDTTQPSTVFDNSKNARATSVSNRLYSKKLDMDEDSEAVQIKKKLDLIDKQIRDIGGANCGWDAADHKDFLRIRTKH